MISNYLKAFQILSTIISMANRNLILCGFIPIDTSTRTFNWRGIEENKENNILELATLKKVHLCLNNRVKLKYVVVLLVYQLYFFWIIRLIVKKLKDKKLNYR